MADITPITNLRGPAARITQVTAAPLPAGAGTKVTMTGPDQNRQFHFEIERGLPGVNALDNDNAVATYVNAADSATRAALDGEFTQRDTLTVLAPRATGSDQTAALNAAITSAAAFGLTLTLNGDHIVNGEILPPSGAKIEGRNGSIRQLMSTRSVFRLENVTGVRITNVRALGKTTDYTNTSAVYRAAAVYCTGATNDVIVSGCTFLGFAGAGVYAASTCSDIHIDRMRYTGADALIPAGSGNFGAGVVIMDGCMNWSVRDSDISLSAQGIVTGHAADNFMVTGNRIHDIVGQHGIYLRAVSGGIVQGNRIWNTNNQGIKIQITDTGPAVSSSVLSISGNEFENIGVHAILLSSTVALAVRLVMITNNIVVGGIGGDGVVVDGAWNTDITIANNTIYGTNYGVRTANGASRIWVHHNSIGDVQRTAVAISGGTFNTVEHNQISNPGQASDIAANSGITLTSVLDGYVLSNRITDSTSRMRYGVYVVAGSMAALDIIDNVAVGATDFGFRGLAEVARVFRGNRFAGTLGAMSAPPTNVPALSDATDPATTMARTNSLLAVARTNGEIR